MNRNFLIQLTNNLYRLTLLFPKKEPLRYKMREKADDILAKPSEKDLEILDSFFEVALVQNWVSPSDILAIKKEYDNLRETLKKDNPVALEIYPERMPALNHNNSDTESRNGGTKGKKRTEFSSPTEFSVETKDKKRFISSPRKEKILAFLKENSKAQVWQIKQIMPDISKRTLRRDFEYMSEQGLIERKGEGNDTFYQVKTC